MQDRKTGGDARFFSSPNSTGWSQRQREVPGTARVTCGEKVSLLSENESTYIPIGMNHRLENPGKLPLHIIEVQSGSYLGEDDIVRFEDIYKRS